MMSWLGIIIELSRTRKVFRQVIDKKDKKALPVKVILTW